MLTLAEAAARLGVAVVTLHRWQRLGRLRVVKISERKWLVPEEELMRLMET